MEDTTTTIGSKTTEVFPDTKKHERVHISEAELFAISVAIGAGAIAYKVAEKVFPVLVEKAGSIITGLLGK